MCDICVCTGWSILDRPVHVCTYLYVYAYICLSLSIPCKFLYLGSHIQQIRINDVVNVGPR